MVQGSLRYAVSMAGERATAAAQGDSTSTPNDAATADHERSEVGPLLELAFDSAKETLQQQHATITALRNRATALLAASSLGTTVAAAIGLLNVDPARGRVFPVWAGWVLVALVLLVGGCVVIILWPAMRWGFGVHPGEMLNDSDRPIESVYRKYVTYMVDAATENRQAIQMRLRAFECGAILLILETAVLIVALGLGGRGR